MSKATLNIRKEEGHLKLGTHFIRVGPNSRSPVLWNVHKYQKVFAKFEAQKELNMEKSELENQLRHLELEFASQPLMSDESKYHVLIMKLLNLSEEEIRDGDD